MELKEKIHKAIELLEDVTTASLAPYPVAGVRQPIKCTGKDKPKKEKVDEEK